MTNHRVRSRTLVIGCVLAVALVVGAVVRPAPASVKAAGSASCSDPAIAFMAPLTGPVASVGTELKNWALFGVARIAAQRHLHVRLVQVDTEFDPAKASTGAQQIVSDSSILGVVGPAASSEVIAVSPIFKRAGIAYVSSSAAQSNLTDGTHPGFFRVNPSNTVQAPSTVSFIAKKLHAKKVVVIDDQSSYALPLADAVQKGLKQDGVEVSRMSASQSSSDFSALITSIPQDAGVVYLAWSVAAKAQVFAEQMKEQGRKSTIVGADGIYDPGHFTIDGGYVFSFAPDIRGIPQDTPVVKAYTKKYGNGWGTYGPPSYVATQVVVNAIAKACASGHGTRAGVLAEVRKTNLSNSILGPLRFTRGGDAVPSRYYVFHIADGKYQLVR